MGDRGEPGPKRPGKPRASVEHGSKSPERRREHEKENYVREHRKTVLFAGIAQVCREKCTRREFDVRLGQSAVSLKIVPIPGTYGEKCAQMANTVRGNYFLKASYFVLPFSNSFHTSHTVFAI